MHRSSRRAEVEFAVRELFFKSGDKVFREWWLLSDEAFAVGFEKCYNLIFLVHQSKHPC
jgi:hypothetical protein